MNRAQRRASGEVPELWYGLCTFWTRDWDKLSTTEGGIPCCPFCESVGFQAPVADWLKWLKEHDKKYPGYEALVLSHENTCFGRGITTAGIALGKGIIPEEEERQVAQ